MTNLVYFGSPEFSSQILDSLIENSPPSEGGDKEGVHFHVVAVVTQPDKPLGRKQVLTPSPVAALASKYDLPIFKPERLDDANLTHLKLLKPDIFLVVSYGKIIPKAWLTLPKIGTFNLHFSLLPKYRGALCISEAIKNQDAQTGVTLMAMDDGLDTGPIISQEKVDIDINDNCETLTNKLTQAGIKLLAKYLPLLAIRHSPFAIRQLSHPQDNSLATYTPTTKTRNRQSAYIPWSQIQPCLGKSQIPARDATQSAAGGSNLKSQMYNVKCERIHALIRSLNPDPGAWTRIPVFSSQSSAASEIEVKIIKTSLKCHPRARLHQLCWKHCGQESGDLYRFPIKSGMTIELVQLPGKTPISWKQFQSRTNLPQDVI